MDSNLTVNCINCKRLCEFEEIEISRQSVEVTVNSKEEKSYDFCLDFVQEFGLRTMLISDQCRTVLFSFLFPILKISMLCFESNLCKHFMVHRYIFSRQYLQVERQYTICRRGEGVIFFHLLHSRHEGK